MSLDTSESPLSAAADLGALLRSLAHDLRSPLHRALGFVRLLEDDLAQSAATASQQRTMLGHVTAADHALEAMRTLIDDVLVLARFGADIEIESLPIDLAQLCRDVAEQSVPALAARQQTLELGLPESPVVIATDAVILSRILTGAIGGASRATPRDAELRLSLKPDVREVTLLLEDGRLTTRAGSRGGAADSPTGTTGLYLALACRFGAHFGGAAQFQALPQRGSRLSLTLPLYGAGAVPASH
jgi:signal transduction histidine kinase